MISTSDGTCLSIATNAGTILQTGVATASIGLGASTVYLIVDANTRITSLTC